MHLYMKIGVFFSWLALILLYDSCTHAPGVGKPTPLQPVLIENVPQRKLFEAKSQLAWVSELAQVASCTIQLPEVIAEIERVERFTHTDKTPEQVSREIWRFNPGKIATYRTKNPFSDAIATTFASDRETLYLNTRKNPRPMPNMVNTACHELSHLNGFGHGDNNPKGKELSVPYFLGAVCEKYAHKCIKAAK